MNDAEILRLAIYESERRMRKAVTQIDIKTGYACPASGCGLRYRHQHDDVWWPPEGQPWPPRPEGSK